MKVTAKTNIEEPKFFGLNLNGWDDEIFAFVVIFGGVVGVISIIAAICILVTGTSFVWGLILSGWPVLFAVHIYRTMSSPYERLHDTELDTIKNYRSLPADVQAQFPDFYDMFNNDELHHDVRHALSDLAEEQAKIEAIPLAERRKEVVDRLRSERDLMRQQYEDMV